MRVHFKTSYHQDIRLFPDARRALRYTGLVVLALALLVTLGYRNLLRAPLGRAFVAIRDSEISAQAMGVNPARTKAAAFGLSCMVTGWAGALMGHFFFTFNHEVFTIVLSISFS